MREEVIKKYEKYEIDVNEVLEKLDLIPISIQCWQLDDIAGFESKESLSGGIQSTGNYPYKARNFEELTSDLKVAISNIPGTKRVNLHAIYQSDDVKDRSEISVNNFKRWIDFAKENNLGIDFNPTCFASPMLKDNLTISSYDKNVRDYWIKHVVNSIKTSEGIAKELNSPVLCNLWFPDGVKEETSDRYALRNNLKTALDEVFTYEYDKSLVDVSVESKLFGIGVESFTVGSYDFYLSYVAKHPYLLNLLDMGHFNVDENVADKLSSLLLFNDKVALHVSRAIRWDSDHVVKLNDTLQELTDEIIKMDAVKKVRIGLDYFDGSINRVAAIIIGTRNVQKALLKSLLTPWDLLKKYQAEGDHTKTLLLQEEIKTLPWNEVWDEYLTSKGYKLDSDWYSDIEEYEEKVMKKRGE